MALGLGWFGGSNFYRYFDKRDELTGRAAINAVVERIIGVESNGDPTIHAVLDRHGLVKRLGRPRAA
jgi:hypothetical protein